jgi:hypothetical protein
MTDDAIIPKRCLGLTPGPAIAGMQYLVTLAVELDDGRTLRVAFPAWDALMYGARCYGQTIDHAGPLTTPQEVA